MADEQIKSALPEWAEEMFHIIQEAENITVPQLDIRPKINEPQEASHQLLQRSPRNESSWFPRWVEWLRVTFETATEENDKDDDVTGWADRVENELMKAYMPTMNLKAIMQKRPTQSCALTLGEIVGHDHSLWSPGNPCLEAQLAALPPPLDGYFRGIYDAMRPARLAILQRVLSVATKLNYKEAKQFARGYSLAMQRGTISESGRPSGETYATNIYLMLHIYSGFVEQLQSVRELHEWMQLMLGKRVVGDLKRVEKICERIGLSFRPPGRPAGK